VFFNGKGKADQALGGFGINTAAFGIKDIHVSHKVVGSSLRQRITGTIITDEVNVNRALFHNLKQQFPLKRGAHQFPFFVFYQIEIHIQGSKNLIVSAVRKAGCDFLFIINFFHRPSL
jgi:hypothetical protein